ncbi:DNA polymerase III, delta subunit [Octadecabacter temperatus]|uniref:DNA-directed DNA polymerase n=1 Tax=Octadecabacter temperatus TaxID=1458307 RepID=A0A0K0Y9D6_9RHOB|nr:DNA polymerase III subunit delta [Octadecabacter temperatus]AKS47574.1 DNA polymerase III subunit delta [Octadecabacter temperatus]SIO41088.1 DNA polymerase III, delta subunit [Octadecabacter temperatus]
MKLSARDAANYFRKPNPKGAGILIYGGDAMRVALKRQDVIKALVGPNGEEEMRLTRMTGAELRKDPALLGDAIKAQGFFPGPRVAFIEEAGDSVTKALTPALADWVEGDAQIVVTAGQLNARSSLRKLFEGHSSAYAAGVYDDPPTRDEIEGSLRDAGLANVGPDAMDLITSLAREMAPGDLRQTIEKLGLYLTGETAVVSVADVEACAPLSNEADLDDILNVVADLKAAEIGPVLSRLYAQGTQPVALCIGALRHFRQLHTVASDPGGASAGIGRLRPPAFGERRDRIMRQASNWGRINLEDALGTITDTDLTLRSAHSAPDRALVERMFIRLAMLGRRRG